MKKIKKEKKYLLFGGLILIALGVAVGVLLFSLQYDELWRCYAHTQQKLLELEEYIAHLDKVWQFFGAVMVLFAIKSFFAVKK